MKRKTLLTIGILGIMLIFGAAVALAQNASSEKTKDAENHECTPEMMEDMSKNCPEQMMQSGNAEAEDGEHCGDMGSDMDSMMGSSSSEKKGMM